jgi:hypothetical protein
MRPELVTDLLDTCSLQLQLATAVHGSTQSTIHYSMHIFFPFSCVFTSLLVTASNGGCSLSSGFLNCSRASATAILGYLQHNHYFLQKTHSRHSKRQSSYKLKFCPINLSTCRHSLPENIFKIVGSLRPGKKHSSFVLKLLQV